MNTPQTNIPKVAPTSPTKTPDQKPAAAPAPHDAPKPGQPGDKPAPTQVRPDSSPHALPQQMQSSMPAQMQQAMPNADAMKGRWQQVVGAAKLTWGKLTDDELLKLEGHEQKLAGLVQERYGITRQVAEQQAREFFAKHLS
jgi:uncharacterized protein YjbJ (UPF0337 family)